MTVAELIDQTLGVIRADFYAGRDREFFRDGLVLTRAICFYGAECAARGWDFKAEFFAAELRDLLREMKARRAEIKYLPVYLSGAVRRRIGLRAEKYNDLCKRKKSPEVLSEKLMQRVSRVEVVREPTPGETCAAVLAGLKKIRGQRKISR